MLLKPLKQQRQPMSKQNLKQLQAEWYGKLKNEGFKDIEQDEDNLKNWASFYFGVKYTPTTFENKQEYYTLAGQFLYHHEFANMFEEFVWKLHSDGLTLAEIVEQLKFHRFEVKSRSPVHLIIKRLAKEMLKVCR